MTTTKMILIAATGAAVTFALLLLVINNLGAKPPGALGERLLILLLPAEIVADIFGTRASFLIAGFLAHLLMRTATGLILDLILGVVGGFVGGWISSLIFGINLMSGVNITSILVALVGAIVVIAIYRLLTRRRM